MRVSPAVNTRQGRGRQAEGGEISGGGLERTCAKYQQQRPAVGSSAKNIQRDYVFEICKHYKITFLERFTRCFLCWSPRFLSRPLA